MSNIHLYNNSNYVPYVECNTSAERGYLNRYNYIKFGIGRGTHDRIVTITVKDSKNRTIKHVSFSSGHDDSWIIRNDGIKRQKYGKSLSTEDPHGTFHAWSTNNEEHFKREDERERQRIEQAEKDRKQRIEEEQARQRRIEQEAKRQAEAAREAERRRIEEAARRQAEAAREAERRRIEEAARRQANAAKEAEKRRIEEAARRQAEAAREAERRRIEEAARRQAEATREAENQRRIAEECRKQRQAAEKEQLYQKLQSKSVQISNSVNKEITKEANEKWSKEHIEATERRDLNEFAENNAKLVIEEEQKNIPISQLKLQSFYEMNLNDHTLSKGELKLLQEIQFAEPLGIEQEVLIQAKTEMISFTNFDGLFAKFTNENVGLAASKIFQTAVFSIVEKYEDDDGTEIFLELFQALVNFQDKKSSHKIFEKEQLIPEIILNFENKWKEIQADKNSSEILVIFDKITNDLNSMILGPILSRKEMLDFSLINIIVKKSSESSKCYVLKVILDQWQNETISNINDFIEFLETMLCLLTNYDNELFMDKLKQLLEKIISQLPLEYNEIEDEISFSLLFQIVNKILTTDPNYIIPSKILDLISLSQKCSLAILEDNARLVNYFLENLPKYLENNDIKTAENIGRLLADSIEQDQILEFKNFDSIFKIITLESSSQDLKKNMSILLAKIELNKECMSKEILDAFWNIIEKDEFCELDFIPLCSNLLRSGFLPNYPELILTNLIRISEMDNHAADIMIWNCITNFIRLDSESINHRILIQIPKVMEHLRINLGNYECAFLWDCLYTLLGANEDDDKIVISSVDNILLNCLKKESNSVKLDFLQMTQNWLNFKKKSHLNIELKVWIPVLLQMFDCVCIIYETLTILLPHPEFTSSIITLILLKFSKKVGPKLDEIIAVCKYLLKTSRFRPVEPNNSLTSILIKQYNRNELDPEEKLIILNSLCCFSSVDDPETTEFILSDARLYLEKTTIPIPIIHKYYISNLQQYSENDLTVLLNYLQQYPHETTPDDLAIIFKIINTFPVLADTISVVLQNVYIMSNLKERSPFSYNIEKVDDVLLPVICYGFWRTRLYRSLTEEEKKLLDKFQIINKESLEVCREGEKYLKWITSLDSGNSEWIEDWLRMDPGAQAFISNEEMTGLTVKQVLYIWYSKGLMDLGNGNTYAAENAFKKVKNIYLDNGFEKDQVYTNSISKLVTILAGKSDYLMALELSNTCEGNEELYNHIQKLQAISASKLSEFDLSAISAQLNQMYCFLNTTIGTEKAEEHIKLCCSKMGLSLFSTTGNDFFQFCLNFEIDYDLNVVQNFETDQWETELMRSYILLTCQSHLGENALENLRSINELFEIMICSNKENLPAVQIFWKNESQKKLSFNNILLMLLILGTKLPHEELNVQSLMSLWIQQLFKRITDAHEEVENFYKFLESSWLTNNSQNLLMMSAMVERLILSTPAIKLAKLAQLLEYSNIQTLTTMLNPFKTETVSLDRFASEVQIRYIYEKVDEIFKKYSIQDSNLSERHITMKENTRQILCDIGSSASDEGFVKQFLELTLDKMGNLVVIDKYLLPNFAKIVSLLYSYQESYEKSKLDLINKLKESEVEAWSNIISDLGALNDAEKTLEELFQELETENANRPVNIQELKEFIDKIPTKKFETIEELTKWAKMHKGNTNVELSEVVSILKEAVFYFKGFYPRSTQLLSFLVLLKTPSTLNGRLAKIATGEGKSIIVAMLASYWALRGKSVDIVTSSTVLAERDAKECKPFYDSLGLSVSDVSGNQEVKGQPKACYNYDVLYGDSSMYQGDILRHEFSLLNTRGSRSFDVVIVDEVDSMLIDQGGHSTRLVDKMPGMVHLQPVLVSIYMHIDQVIGRMFPIQGEMRFMEDVSGANSGDYVDVISKCLQYFNLFDHLQKFCNAEQAKELVDEDIKKAYSVIMEAGLTPAHCKTIEQTIEYRWGLDTKFQILMNIQKFLNTKITILSLASDGFKLHPDFHDGIFPNEYDEKDNVKTLVLIEIEGKYYQLLPVDNENEFIFKKVRDNVKPTFVQGYPSTITDNKIKIPNHLWNLYEVKLDKWIESAISAKCHLVENRDYLIKQIENFNTRKVVPIDFESTGVLQEGTVWSDGVHQFLQIKHQLAVTSENLATNFLSNLAYFRRYNGNIYGLTGTLGSEVEKELLINTYHVDTVNVPQFKKKQHLYMPELVVPSIDNWLSAIATSVLAQREKGRSVLIIGKSIKDVYTIEAYLNNIVKDSNTIEKIDKYTRSDNEAEVESIEQKMKPGKIIIATNLAGRGTDIKLSQQVLQSGGLHVCITFLPSNLRVEQQATGRASRGGQPGTSQLIINAETDGIFPEMINFLDAKEIKSCRDSHEKHRVDKIRSEIIPNLDTDEVNFKSFVSLRNFVHSLKDAETLAAVDERWGLALDVSKTIKTKNSDFMPLFRTLAAEVSQESVIQNPYYYINKGINSNADADYKKAIQYFNKATALDALHTANAHYYKAYSIINKFDDNYKEDAMDSLNIAVNLIQDINIPALIASNNMMSPDTPRQIIDPSQPVAKVNNEDTEFTKQIVNKISLLQVQVKSVEEALKVINKEKEVEAEMMGIHNYFEEQKIPPPESAIDESRETGLVGFIKIVKKPPPWWAVFVVIFIGIIQVVAGAALAIVTGGAFGTGLIVDGVGDVVTGIKAAVNGEYISLGDFFKEKAISIAISAVAMAAGAALSAAAKTISTVVKNVASKFMNSAVGKFLKPIFQFGKNMATSGSNFAKTAYSSASKFVSTVYSSAKEMIKSTFSTIKSSIAAGWSKFSNFVIKVSPTWLKNAGNFAKEKLMNAWNYLKDKWNGAMDWTKQKMNNLYTKLNGEKEITAAQKKKLKEVTREIGKEVMKTGIVEGLNYASDHLIMDPLMEAIRAKLEEDLRKQIQDEMNKPELDKLIDDYFNCCKDEAEFDSRWKQLEKYAKQSVTSQISKPGEAETYAIQGVTKFASEVKRIMGSKKNPWGHRNVIQNTINITVSTALKSAAFIKMVESLATFVNCAISSLKSNLNSTTIQVVSTTQYISTKNGTATLEFVKSEVAKNIAKDISEQMADLIRNGIIKPVRNYSVSEIQKKLNPIKEKPKTDKTYRRQNAGEFTDDYQKKEFKRQNAGEVTYDSDDDNYNVTRPSDKELRRMSAGEFDGSNNKRTRFREEEDYYKQQSALRALSFGSSKSIEVYKISDQGDLELSQLVGSSGRKSLKEPIRVVQSNDINNSDGIKYNPIVTTEDGLGLVSLDDLDPTLKNVGGSESLFSSFAVQSKNDENINDVLSRFNTISRSSSVFDKNVFGIERVDNILRVFEFKVHG